MASNELLYGYVDNEVEKEFMAIEAAFDIEMAKQNLAYEYADKLLDIKYMQSNLKVLNESGTFDDIEALYEAAGEEANTRKQGVLSSIWQAIVNFVNNIIDAIKRVFTRKQEDDIKNGVAAGELTEDNAPKVKDPNKVMSALNTAVSKIGAILNKATHVTNEDGESVVSIVKTAGTAIAAAATVAISWLSVTKLVGQGTKLFNSIKDIAAKRAETKKTLEEKRTMDGGGPSAEKKIQTAVQELAKTAKGWLDSILNAVTGAVKKVGAGKGEKASGGNKGGKKFGRNKNKKGAAQAAPEAAPAAEGEQAATESSIFDFIDDEEDDDDNTGFMESEEFEQSCQSVIDLIDSL